MKIYLSSRAICVTLISCFSSHALAQRGARYEGNAHPWDSPTRGFPGYFDTNVAEKGSWVVELPPLIYGAIPMPSTEVDYGVSESLTVGSNALLTTVPWLFGAQGASIKVRSLLVGTPEHQSVATVYAGYLGVYNRTPTGSGLYENATWNHSWRPAREHTITGHINYLRLDGSLGKSSDLNYARVSVTTLMLGAGYGYEINEQWNIRGMIATTAYSSLDIMTSLADLSQTTSPAITKNPNRLGQLQLEFHTVTDWLVGFGAIHGYFSGSGGTVPWLTFAFRK